MGLFRSLDNEDDWKFGHGKADYATKNDCVGFNVKTRLREWKFDWFADYQKGIDWKARLSNKNQKDALDNDVQEVINNTDDVVYISKFESTLDTYSRTYTADIRIITVYGEEEINLIIGGQ